MLPLCFCALGLLLLLSHPALVTSLQHDQTPLVRPVDDNIITAYPERRNVSVPLFQELEELARVVDIAYCVGSTNLGISKPFQCLSRCTDFPAFELVTTWNSGLLLTDSCGYIALDHAKRRILVAFRGTYSITNTIVDLSTIPQKYEPYPGEGDGDDDRDERSPARDHEEPKEPMCHNCTVHSGFQTSWHVTRREIMPSLQEQVTLHREYQMTLVGHSLGGAIAALAALDFRARGWDPQVTTFGEPRVGNVGLVKYIDQRFGLTQPLPANDTLLRYRRLTHLDDPVPLLPLTEWGFAMHAGEIHISKSSLSPDLLDLHHCEGDVDPTCIAGQDATVSSELASTDQSLLQKGDLLSSVQHEIHDVVNEPWGIPSRYKLWQLVFAHRDYFWRIGLCVPGGDPIGGGSKFDKE